MHLFQAIFAERQALKNVFYCILLISVRHHSNWLKGKSNFVGDYYQFYNSPDYDSLALNTDNSPAINYLVQETFGWVCSEMFILLSDHSLSPRCVSVRHADRPLGCSSEIIKVPYTGLSKSNAAQK